MLIVLLTNRKDYELFLSDVVFAFDGFFGLVRQAHHRWLRTSLGDFGFATGGFCHLTNMAEKNCLLRVTEMSGQAN